MVEDGLAHSPSPYGQQKRVFERSRRCGAGQLVEQRNLAEMLAGAHHL